MVSKTIRKTPTKNLTPTKTLTPKHLRRRRRSSSSPLKSIAAAPSLVASSIHRSLRSCRRRLIKIFTRLTILGTPIKTPKKKRGFHRLAPLPISGPTPIPPPLSPEKPTLFLDLDETLVHSQTTPFPVAHDFVVRPTIDGQAMPFYVLKRPGVDKMLQEISNSFEVVVFTAGLREYASLVLDKLDPRNEMISHRLYRDSCKEMEGGRFVKDLSKTGRELGRVVIVDDNPNAYSLHPENAVPIAPFIDDLGDKELERVSRFLETAALSEDLRDAVALHLSGNAVEKYKA